MVDEIDPNVHSRITREHFLERVAEMMDKEKVKALQEAEKLWALSVIQPGNYRDDYVLPKEFLVAYLQYAAEQWSPPGGWSRAEKREITQFRTAIG